MKLESQESYFLIKTILKTLTEILRQSKNFDKSLIILGHGRDKKSRQHVLLT